MNTIAKKNNKFKKLHGADLVKASGGISGNGQRAQAEAGSHSHGSGHSKSLRGYHPPCERG